MSLTLQEIGELLTLHLSIEDQEAADEELAQMTNEVQPTLPSAPGHVPETLVAENQREKRILEPA
jgi:hypothetical protein